VGSGEQEIKRSHGEIRPLADQRPEAAKFQKRQAPNSRETPKSELRASCLCASVAVWPNGVSRQSGLIPPPANHNYSAHEHCAEDERSTSNRPGAWALAQREHHPDRIQYRLDQWN
jgi:hypothetical protein